VAGHPESYPRLPGRQEPNAVGALAHRPAKISFFTKYKSGMSPGKVRSPLEKGDMELSCRYPLHGGIPGEFSDPGRGEALCRGLAAAGLPEPAAPCWFIGGLKLLVEGRRALGGPGRGFGPNHHWAPLRKMPYCYPERSEGAITY
jgi:hypothetical protein